MRTRFVLAIAAALTTMGAAAAPPASAAAQATASPNPSSTINELTGVSAVSAHNAWAVGYYQNNTTHLLDTLILHWNGTAWSRVKSPNPGSNGNVLDGVSAVSATNAWAVGDEQASSTSSVPGKTLILHWNGTAWSHARSPSPSPSGNALRAVSAVSGTDAWAVGDQVTSFGTPGKTLTLHWNGTAWSRVKSPNPADFDNQLNAVSAISGTDAWAAGQYPSGASQNPTPLIGHWNGQVWSRVMQFFGGSPVLNGMSAVSGTDIWTVGNNSAGIPVMYMLHWNGTSWSDLSNGPNPSSTFNELTGVSAVSANDAWAVGYYQNDTTHLLDTLIEHWNGTWSAVKSPNPGSNGNVLTGVSAVSATNAWAVGDQQASSTSSVPGKTLILHWNGTAWSKT